MGRPGRWPGKSHLVDGVEPDADVVGAASGDEGAEVGGERVGNHDGFVAETSMWPGWTAGW
jgi:hypothetical protein